MNWDIIVMAIEKVKTQLIQVFRSRTNVNIAKEKDIINSLIEGFKVSHNDEVMFFQSTIVEYCAKNNYSSAWARKIIHVMLKETHAGRIHVSNERKACYQLIPMFIKEPELFSAATKERMLMSYMSKSAVMSRMMRPATSTSQLAI